MFRIRRFRTHCLRRSSTVDCSDMRSLCHDSISYTDERRFGILGDCSEGLRRFWGRIQALQVVSVLPLRRTFAIELVVRRGGGTVGVLMRCPDDLASVLRRPRGVVFCCSPPNLTSFSNRIPPISISAYTNFIFICFYSIRIDEIQNLSVFTKFVAFREFCYEFHRFAKFGRKRITSEPEG